LENYLTFEGHPTFEKCVYLMLIRSKSHVQIVDYGIFV
jgi:hypothetical protein